MKRFAIAAVLLLAPLAAPAQVYKCTGKDGRVTFSQTKPRDSACAETAGTAATTPTGAGSGSTMDNLMKFSGEIDKQRAEQAKVDAEAAQQDAMKKAACSQSRRRLALLQQSSRMFVMKEDGTREYKSDAQKDAAEAEAQAAVAQFCS